MKITWKIDSNEHNSLSQMPLKMNETDLFMSRSNEKIQQVKRTAIEIDSNSKHVIIEIENQTQKLSLISGKVDLLNQSIDNSNSIV